jgi:hypothetical protein
MHTLLYEYLGSIEPINPKIEEVTTDASLSTETSSTTKRTTPLNLGTIEKYKHPHQA